MISNDLLLRPPAFLTPIRRRRSPDTKGFFRLPAAKDVASGKHPSRLCTSRSPISFDLK